LLHDPNAIVRAEAARLIGDPGPDGVRLVPRLVELFHDPVRHVVLAAGNALNRLGDVGRFCSPFSNARTMFQTIS
jgi:hypothetical protein